MSIKGFGKLILAYFLFFITGTSLFIGLLWTDFFISINALFYRSFILLILSVVFCAAIMLLIMLSKWIPEITFRDIILSAALVFFINFIVYIMIPFNVSRSNSVLILGYLNQSSELRTEQEITGFVAKKYIYEYRAIEIRIKEQISSGNIKETNGKYQLTPNGMNTLKFLKNVSKIYRVNNNFAE